LFPVKDFKNTTEKELSEMLLEKRNSLRDFRFRVAKGKVKNVKSGRGLRKEIAVILTEVSNRKHGKQKK